MPQYIRSLRCFLLSSIVTISTLFNVGYAVPSDLRWLPVSTNFAELSDANGWHLPQYSTTIQAIEFNKEIYMLARGHRGVNTWRLDGSRWVRIRSSNPPLSDASGWNDSTNYNTIQTVEAGSNLFLIARADAGISTWRLDGNRWVRISAGVPPWSDRSGWNDYWGQVITIQGVSVGDELYLLGRADNGIHTWRLDGDRWTQVASNVPPWGDDEAIGRVTPGGGNPIKATDVNGVLYITTHDHARDLFHTWRLQGTTWQEVSSDAPTYPPQNDIRGAGGHLNIYDTLAHNGSLYLIGLFDTGVSTWILDGNHWEVVALQDPPLTQEAGWGDADNFMSAEFVSYESYIHLIVRSDNGINLYRLGETAWSRVISNDPPWSDQSGWEDTSNASTIQVITADGEMYLLGRGDNGLNTYRLAQ